MSKTPTFAGKVALVTGASKGIGAEIALQLAAGGAAVAVNYASSKAGADAVVAKIVAQGGKAVAVHGDLAEASSAAALVAETVKALGPIDILVNNAGVYDFAPLDGITPEHFHKHFNVNVLGLLLVSQAAVRQFNPAGGSIINISSGVSTILPPNAAVYTATKASVDAITGVLAKELAPKNPRQRRQSRHDRHRGRRLGRDRRRRDAQLDRIGDADGPDRQGRGNRLRRRLPRLRCGSLRHRRNAACDGRAEVRIGRSSTVLPGCA